MRRAVIALSMLLAVLASARAEGDDLKPGPGHDTVAVACAVCHSLDYIRMNAPFLTPDQWKAEIAKMRNAFAAPLDDAAADEILRYLSTEYGAPPKS